VTSEKRREKITESYIKMIKKIFPLKSRLREIKHCVSGAQK